MQTTSSQSYKVKALFELSHHKLLQWAVLKELEHPTIEMMEEVPDRAKAAQWQQYADAGNTLEAIKAYRALTGEGLVASRDAVYHYNAARTNR